MGKWKQGSFTVEAAMIMGVVLLVIFSVLGGSRFVYERVMESAAEYEKALLEKVYDPDPVTYSRQAQAVKDMIQEE